MKSEQIVNAGLFSSKILEWWNRNQREFPWRDTLEPYRIFVAEILLHRTRAEQVTPIYLEFIRKFPSIEDLTRSSMSEIKKVVHSLGLYWRIEKLYQSALLIKSKYQGNIPVSHEELVSLPGVGPYISSAVRCFAYGIPEVLIDTNTIRILGRVFDMKITDSSRRSVKFRELYNQIIDFNNAKEFNYAMIDLGSLVCKARGPLCGKCPVKESCNFGILRGGRSERDISN